MTAPAPSPASRRLRPVDLARLLLVVLPCVPGLIFLAVGMVRDPRGLVQDRMTPAMQSERARAALQARELYLVGAITLFAETLGMAAVIWKIARTQPETAD